MRSVPRPPARCGSAAGAWIGSPGSSPAPSQGLPRSARHLVTFPWRPAAGPSHQPVERHPVCPSLALLKNSTVCSAATLFREDFAGRILAFGEETAAAHADPFAL